MRVVGARHYSADQIAAWSARAPAAQERITERAANGAVLIVAVGADDVAVAYTLLERDGHLDHLYCHPDHTRMGLADELLAAAEQQARDWNCAKLYTEASELARPAFERAGYVVSHRRDFEIGGVPIHNYAMEKLLD